MPSPTYRISSSGYKPSNWSCLTSVSCGVWWWIFHSSIHEGRHNTPKFGQILCNAYHKVVHQIILTSRILGSLQILRKIPGKLQDKSRASLQIITTTCSRRCSPNLLYIKVQSARDFLPLNFKNSSLQGFFQYIKTKESWFYSKGIWHAQWDTILQGR